MKYFVDFARSDRTKYCNPRFRVTPSWYLDHANYYVSVYYGKGVYSGNHRDLQTAFNVMVMNHQGTMLKKQAQRLRVSL